MAASRRRSCPLQFAGNDFTTFVALSIHAINCSSSPTPSGSISTQPFKNVTATHSRPRPTANPCQPSSRHRRCPSLAFRASLLSWEPEPARSPSRRSSAASTRGCPARFGRSRSDLGATGRFHDRPGAGILGATARTTRRFGSLSCTRPPKERRERRPIPCPYGAWHTGRTCR